VLSPEVANRYQSARGVLRWAVELGRIDLTTKTHMLAANMAVPNEGHLITILWVFLYLKNYHNARIACDPTYTEIDFSKFERRDWRRFYNKVKELMPLNVPKPLANPW
jgi:hypothetical protein